MIRVRQIRAAKLYELGDGKEIFYGNLPAGSIMAAEVTSDKGTTVFTGR